MQANAPSIVGPEAKPWLRARLLLGLGLGCFVVSQLGIADESGMGAGWLLKGIGVYLGRALMNAVNGSAVDFLATGCAIMAIPFVVIVAGACWAVEFLYQARPLLTLVRIILMGYLLSTPMTLFLLLGVAGLGNPLGSLALLCAALLTFIGIYAIPEAESRKQT